mgnify:CR=1 FL=1
MAAPETILDWLKGGYWTLVQRAISRNRGGDPKPERAIQILLAGAGLSALRLIRAESPDLAEVFQKAGRAATTAPKPTRLAVLTLGRTEALAPLSADPRRLSIRR